MDSTVAMNTACHFLRLPAEIRLHIYRYLLLDFARAYLDPYDGKKAFNDMIDRDQEAIDEQYFFEQFYNGRLVATQPQQQLDAFVAETGIHEQSELSDEQKFYDRDYFHPDSEEGTVMYDHLFVDQRDLGWGTALTLAAHRDEQKRKFYGMEKIQRCTAVLRTNRQIYNEASTLLYSSLVMHVKPGDVMFSETWDGIVKPSHDIWQSWPARLGDKNPIEQDGYNRSRNLGGTMEPRAFARFERVAFNVNLDLIDGCMEEIPEWPTLFVDHTFYTSREDEDSLIARLNGEGTKLPPFSSIFQQLVDVLVGSPYIRHLDISLSVEVEAAFDIDSEDEEEDDEESIDEIWGVQDEKEEKKIKVANERATELVLEADVLNPLKGLSNVKCFELSFASSKPKPRLLDIVRDLKEKVEGNFAAKHRTA